MTDTRAPVDTYAPDFGSNDFRPQMEPPRVEFGTLPNHSFPHEWAVWIFTGMRNAELAKERPRPFSAWLSAACLHFAGMDAE